MTQLKIIEQKIKHSNGQITLKKYMLGNFLGKGGFAKCYQAKQLQSQEEFAIKVINKEGLMKNRAKQKLLSQIKIHRSLNHPYIVKFKSVFEDQANVYIVLELCKGKSLSDMVKKRKNLTCQQTRYYILQLLSALEYLHANKIIHRDLKMANIFLSENMELKLGDFGLSAKLQYCQEKKRTMAGTPNYIAPEIIDGSGGHSYEVDLWSTGVICYALLFGRPPFQTAEIKMTYNRIKNCQYHFPSGINVPNSAKDFIRRTLVVDPKKRMTIAQMYEHSFLRESRPKYIPFIASEQAPRFTPSDLINNESNNNLYSISESSEDINKPQTQVNLNILKNSLHINKSENPKHQLQPDNQKHAKTDRVQYGRVGNQNIYQEKLTKNKVINSIGVIVLSHVDYSTKYGLGYTLSNGYMGVYFNDSTITAIDSKKQRYFYINDPAHNEKVEVYNEPNLPTDYNFTKKKMLLFKFKSHLNQESKNDEITEEENSNEHIFVKQWLKTKHAIMFRLSNKIFQVNFFDHSQILLRTDTKEIKFKNKKGEEQILTLSEALHGKQRQTQLGRRIKYTKQILNSLKKNQTQNEGKQQ